MVVIIMVGVTNPVWELLSLMSTTLWNALPYSFVCACLWTKVSLRIVVYTVNDDVTTSKGKMDLGIPVAAFFVGVPH